MTPVSPAALRIVPTSAPPSVAISNDWSVVDVTRKVDRLLAWYGLDLSVQKIAREGEDGYRVDLLEPAPESLWRLRIDRRTGSIWSSRRKHVPQAAGSAAGANDEAAARISSTVAVRAPEAR